MKYKWVIFYGNQPLQGKLVYLEMVDVLKLNSYPIDPINLQ